MSFTLFEPLLRSAIGILFWVCLWMIPVALLALLAWWCLSLPLRRQERARFLLDLIEVGLKNGQSPERAIMASSQSLDPSLGVRHHLLAAHLESGCSLGRALDKVPSLLPPQVRAMLQTGEYLGSLGRVLPACRLLLDEAHSHVRGTTNFTIAALLVGNPLLLVSIPFVLVKVYPVFGEIMAAFGKKWPAGMQNLDGAFSGLFSLQMVSAAVVVSIVAFFIGGPRLAQWLQAGWPPVLDRYFCLLPWRRRRLERDFSAMLAILLDAELPEPKAVLLAAECTANRVYLERAHRVAPRLAQGESLLDAVEEIDASGELRWRLANAVHARRGFHASLQGWHETLTARAFKLEQAAAHFISTALVLMNGLFVAWIAWAFFSALMMVESAPFPDWNAKW